MEKDDLGIEVDDDVAQALKDPKGPLLMKILDYREKRKAKEKEAEEAKNPKKVTKSFWEF